MFPLVRELADDDSVRSGRRSRAHLGLAARGVHWASGGRVLRSSRDLGLSSRRNLLACTDSGLVPFAEEQIDMILLERVFRYPQSDDATRNFDSGTGVLLYSWFREHGALTGSSAEGGQLRLDRPRRNRGASRIRCHRGNTLAESLGLTVRARSIDPTELACWMTGWCAAITSQVQRPRTD